ncbi:MAG TPA: class I SAM-dependent methyltransferase [Pseudonocardiaceae bacterium]|jgi:SAM-dependent methyltransferase|nr:class I SAM-dependent methyltransferase [Pseudonocardiaceae bacterium]
MIYEHPLAYLLGMEGLALLRGFIGEYDQEFVDARLAEVRLLLADESLADAAVDVARIDPEEGYRLWSRSYQAGRSGFDFDEPLVNEIIDPLPPGVALDAACGTGRWTAHLTARGHQVIGVDATPEMLAHAKARVPEAEFRVGNLHQLPVEDNAVDLVMCALALTHLPDLDPVIAEFARVLRPGGHLVIADMHPERVLRAAVPTLRRANGQPARPASYRHLVGDYLRAALPVGLDVRRCAEPTIADDPPAAAKLPVESLGPWEVWPWSLAELVPDATTAADSGVPVMLIWDFEATKR